MMEDNLLVILAAVGIVALAVLGWCASRPIMFLYLAIFGTAILKTPELPVVREKLTIVEGFMGLLWLCWLWIPKKPMGSPMEKQVRLYGGIFCGVVLLSSLVAIASMPPFLNRAFGGRLAPYSLLEAANYCYGVLILWTCVRLLDSWHRWLGAIIAWVAGAAVASLVGLAAVARLAPGWAYEDTGRICSTLRNENQVPSMILPLLVVLLLFAVRRGLGGWVRLALLGLVAATFLTAIGTGSRTAVLMIILAALGTYWIFIGSDRLRAILHTYQLTNLAVFFSVAIVFYFGVAWANYDGRYSLVSTPSWQRPAVLLIEWFDGERKLDSTRPRQIQAAMEQFWRSPILGTGPKFGAITAGTGGEVHNTYFSLLLEVGMFGCGAFLALLWIAFRATLQSVKVCRYPWFAALGRALIIGLLVLCLYNATMLGLRQRNIWFLLGTMYAYVDLVQQGVLIDWRVVQRVPMGLRSLFWDHGGVVWGFKPQVAGEMPAPNASSGLR